MSEQSYYEFEYRQLKERMELAVKTHKLIKRSLVATYISVALTVINLILSVLIYSHL